VKDTHTQTRTHAFLSPYVPILLSKTNISLSSAGVGKFPLKVKAVAVLGRKVISVGVTVKAGITTFLTGTPADVMRINKLEGNN
jgi:uncharacterized membrane protein